jgi:patatin-like phospholipase/acyl hydrolase
MQLSGRALRTGLLVCTGPIDGSGSSLLANNPRSPSWEKDRHVKLVDIIRASTGGPGDVRPAMIPLSGDASGVFVDRAMAGHVNPALAAFLYAQACSLAPHAGDPDVLPARPASG